MTRGVLWILFLVAIWEFCSRTFAGLHFVLPAPSIILMGMWHHADRFALHSLVTLREMLGGILYALLLAIPLAAAMMTWQSAKVVLHPMIVLSQCLPTFALAPLMVIWFGWSYTSVVVPVVLMTFVPLTLSTYQGLKAVPQAYVESFVTYGASSRQTFFMLRLPWALPQLCSGLRIAAAFAGMGAVAGEWAGGQQGLGVLMLESRRGADLVTTFGSILCVLALTLIFYAITSSLEHLATLRRPLAVLWRDSSMRMTILLTLAAIVGLGGISQIGRVQDIPRAHVRLMLDWMPNPNHVPLFVAVNEGIFAKHGIDLEILKVHDPGDIVPYISSGQAEVAVTYMTSLLLGAKQHGADFKVIGYLIKEPLNSIIYNDSEEIKAPSNLSGKVIGCVTDGIQTQLLRRILILNHVKPANLPTVNFDLVGLLVNNQLDAIFGAYWNIEAEQLHVKGFDVGYFRMKDLGVPHHFELVLVASKDSPLATLEATNRFKAALDEAMKYCRANPEKAFAKYIAANPDKTQATLEWERPSWGETVKLIAPNQSDDLPVWEHYYDWLRNQGLIGYPFDLNELFPSD